MLLVRDVFHCKPGKVKPLVEKFLQIGKLGEKYGWPKSRVTTDVSGARYWTVVSEMEAPSMEAFMSMGGEDSEGMKEMGEIMKGYHDLVDSGHREIYKIEG